MMKPTTAGGRLAIERKAPAAKPTAASGLSSARKPATAAGSGLGSAVRPASATGKRPITGAGAGASTRAAAATPSATPLRPSAATNQFSNTVIHTATVPGSVSKPAVAATTAPAAVNASTSAGAAGGLSVNAQPSAATAAALAAYGMGDVKYSTGSNSESKSAAGANADSDASGNSSVLASDAAAPKMEDMIFTELHKHSGVCVFSPNGKFIATTEKYQLFIRDAETLEILQLYTCLDAISLVRWSPDSQYVLCAQFKRRIVQVWSVDDSDWVCKIDEGLAGLSYAWWSPDSRHILTATDFQLRLTIWSLVRRSVCFIKYPKFADRGVSFSHDGQYLAVVERREFRDWISIYWVGAGNPTAAQAAAVAANTAAGGNGAGTAMGWSLIKSYPVETEDLTDIQWSPDDRVICAYDSPLTYNIVLYTADGRKLARYSAYDHALGIKSVSFSKSSQFLSVGSYDDVVRLFNHMTWKSLGEYKHTATISTEQTVVYIEQYLIGADGQPISAIAAANAAAAGDNKENMGPDATARRIGADDDDLDVSSEVGFRSKLAQLKSLEAISSFGTADSKSKSTASSTKAKGGSGSGSASVNTSVLNASTATGRRSGASGSTGNGKDMVVAANSKSDATPLEYTPSQYVVSSSSVYEIPVSVKADPDKPDPPIGVGVLEWSSDDRYLATRNDTQPNTVWIWDTARLQCVSVLQQQSAVRSMRWDPVRSRLAVCTGTNKLYMWTPEGCAIVDVMPGNFGVRSVRWNPSGTSIILMGKDRFCCCHPPQ